MCLYFFFVYNFHKSNYFRLRFRSVRIVIVTIRVIRVLKYIFFLYFNSGLCNY